VLVFLHLTSMFTFAVLISILSSEISRAVESLRVGNFRVPEENHTVVLGWDRTRTPFLIQQVSDSTGRLWFCLRSMTVGCHQP
jgi:hypothetical protein